MAQGFSEKNKDELPPALIETCQAGDPVFLMIFEGIDFCFKNTY